MRSRSNIRQSAAVSAVLLAALFLLPLAVIVPFRSALAGKKAAPDKPPEPKPEVRLPFESGALDGDVPLRVLDGGEVREMDLGTYLVGVVRAEMPASFELEALKAQACAARTYTLYKLSNGGNHGDTANICTDSTCCQAYISEEQAFSNWGGDAAAYEQKVERAVSETDGQAILYDNTPVLAVFHSSSSGLTRAAGEVWLNDLPYLQPVQSPEPGDTIPNYHSRVDFTAEEFRTKFLEAHPEADFSGPAGNWLSDLVSDEAGSVRTLRVGGVEVKGTQLRSILGLRSACFTWEVQNGTVSFFVTGYGHGVGLSQYGANQMAADGADFREILTHYYTGVTIGPVK